MQIKICQSLTDIQPGEWNSLVNDSYPFIQYEFLIALERHQAVGEEFGWVPRFYLVYDKDKLIAALPLYIKTNSYGEFVFDWAWADAYHRSHIHYYPKLVSAIPYTPATGPRILVSEDQSYDVVTGKLIDFLQDDINNNNFSSFHCLFTNQQDTDFFKQQDNFMLRLGCQFHWQNNHYQDFEHFLSFLVSKKRKQIKRERRIVQEQEIEFEIHNGHSATDEIWEIYHRFYVNTFDRKSGYPTLSKGFFREISQTMPDNIVLVMAKHHDEYVAAAFNLQSDTTLYGRHWGCNESFDNLHFEACYYQGLEYCIKNKLQSFEPGAQGEHKIARGFMPTKTWSAHYIAHPQFKTAIEQFLQHETEGMIHYINELNSHSPYKTNS